MNISLDDYKKAILQLQNHFKNVPEPVRPISIIQNGNVGTVGISDIDLIFVFPDTFDQGIGFDKEYQKAIEPIQYKEVFFVHHPMLLSESAIKNLPYYTHNPAENLNVIFGQKPRFSAQASPPIQSVLISLEFIQFRLFQLVNQLLSGQISLQGILLRGHSLKHSVNLGKRAGLKFDDEKFPAFDIVKAIRASINKGEKMNFSAEELSNLHKGIIREFYIVYKKFCQKAESYVSFYLPERDHYEYDANIFLTGLFNEKNHLHRKINKESITVEGFHWINMLLRDLYFNENRIEGSVVDRKFIDECKKRARTHREQWRWNKKNFNNIHAGLSPMPCVIGKQAHQYAKESWGI